jgi:hypothetical protein
MKLNNIYVFCPIRIEDKHIQYINLISCPVRCVNRITSRCYPPRSDMFTQLSWHETKQLYQQNMHIMSIYFTWKSPYFNSHMLNHHCSSRLRLLTTMFQLIENSKSKWNNQIPETGYGLLHIGYYKWNGC